MRWRWVVIGVGGPLLLAASGVIFYLATLYPAGPPQRGHLALVGATVLTGSDLKPQPDATVLIRDGVIAEIGPAGTVPVPANATVVDLRGFTVLPGLIDLHTHLGSPNLQARQQPGPTTLPRMIFDAVRFAPGHRRAALEHGVTTVRNLGDEHRWILVRSASSSAMAG